jgi:hypothetical protein
MALIIAAIVVASIHIYFIVKNHGMGTPNFE